MDALRMLRRKQIEGSTTRLETYVLIAGHDGTMKYDAAEDLLTLEADKADLLEALEKVLPYFAVLRQYVPGPALDVLESECRVAIAQAKGK